MRSAQTHSNALLPGSMGYRITPSRPGGRELVRVRRRGFRLVSRKIVQAARNSDAAGVQVLAISVNIRRSVSEAVAATQSTGTCVRNPATPPDRPRPTQTRPDGNSIRGQGH